MWESPVTTVLEFPVFIFHSFPPMTSTFLQISNKFSTPKLIPFHGDIFRKPTLSFSPLESKLASFQQRSFKLGAYRERWSFLGGRGFSRNGVLLEDEGGGRKKRVVLVKNNQGFGFNGGGGERDDGASARILGNLALATGLAYLSTTGQLGWLGSILDAIVSIWLFAVLVPIVGLGAFLWWAGQDIKEGSCPNCGNAFQVFKSFLNDDLQLCPFCGLPFSAVGDEFVKDSVKFSNQSTTFGQAFNNFSHSRNEEDYGRAIDVEAEIKDVD